MENKNIFFIISEEIAKQYPDLRIGILVGEDLSNTEYDEKLKKLIRKTESRMREKLSVEEFSNHPHILAWRKAYRSFGVKPKKYRPTCEALVRRVLRGESLPWINKVVNCYLLTELEFLVPCGGYDVNKLEGDVYLRYSDGNEEFVPLGGKDVEFTKPREIIYSDDRKVLTRKWNYRDADVTKITAETKDIVLFSEAPFKDISTDALEGFLKRLSELLNQFCGGSTKYEIIEANKNLTYKIF